METLLYPAKGEYASGSLDWATLAVDERSIIVLPSGYSQFLKMERIISSTNSA